MVSKLEGEKRLFPATQPLSARSNLSHRLTDIRPLEKEILLVPWLHIVKTVYKRIFACKLTNNICVIILVRCRGPHLLFATRLHTSYLGWCRESAEGPAT